MSSVNASSAPVEPDPLGDERRRVDGAVRERVDHREELAARVVHDEVHGQLLHQRA